MRGPIVHPRYAEVKSPTCFLLDDAHGGADDFGQHAAAFDGASGKWSVAVRGEELDPAHHRGNHDRRVGARRRQRGRCRVLQWRLGLRRLSRTADARQGDRKSGHEERCIGAESILIGVEDDGPLRGVAVNAGGDLSQRVPLLDLVFRAASLSRRRAGSQDIHDGHQEQHQQDATNVSTTHAERIHDPPLIGPTEPQRRGVIPVTFRCPCYISINICEKLP